MNLEAVLFDMDGVITDTEKYYNRSWPIAFHECGYTDYTREDALLQRSLNHTDAQKLWEARYGSAFCFEDVHKRNTQIVLELMEREGIEAKPGVADLLAYLKSTGIPADLKVNNSTTNTASMDTRLTTTLSRSKVFFRSYWLVDSPVTRISPS